MAEWVQAVLTLVTMFFAGSAFVFQLISRANREAQHAQNQAALSDMRATMQIGLSEVRVEMANLRVWAHERFIARSEE